MLKTEAQTAQLAARTLVSARVAAWEAQFPFPLAQVGLPRLFGLQELAAALNGCSISERLQHFRVDLWQGLADAATCSAAHCETLPPTRVSPLPTGAVILGPGRRSGDRDCGTAQHGAGAG